MQQIFIKHIENIQKKSADRNNYIIAKCIQYAGYCLKDLYLFIKRTKIALCPHHAQSLAMKSLAGLWEEGEKAFCADAATDLARVHRSRSPDPTTQSSFSSAQNSAEGKGREGIRRAQN